MRKKTVCLLGTMLLGGTLQAANLKSDPVGAMPDSMVNIAIQLDNEGNDVAGLQFDLEFDAGVLTLDAMAGSAALDAGKTLSVSGSGNSRRFLIIGFNQTLIAAGPVVVLNLGVSAQATGSYTLSFSGLAATDAAGGAVNLSADDIVISISNGGQPPFPDFVFPQFVNGTLGEFVNRSRLVIRNLGSTPETGAVDFVDAAGKPNPVSVRGEMVSNVAFTLPPWGVTEIVTEGTGALTSGCALVSAQEGKQSNLSGALIFELLGNFVSVASAGISDARRIYVSSNLEEDTGVAIYNPGEQAVTLSLVLADQLGLEVKRRTVTLTGTNQLVAFLRSPTFFGEYFDDNPEVFRGSLNIHLMSGPNGVAVLGLIQRLDTGALFSVPTDSRVLPEAGI